MVVCYLDRYNPARTACVRASGHMVDSISWCWACKSTSLSRCGCHGASISEKDWHQEPTPPSYRRRPVSTLYDSAVAESMKLIRKETILADPHDVCPPPGAEPRQDYSSKMCFRCLLPLRIREDLLSLATSDSIILDRTKLAIFESCVDPGILNVRMRGFIDTDFVRICETLRNHGRGLRNLELDTPYPSSSSSSPSSSPSRHHHLSPVCPPSATSGLHYDALLSAFQGMPNLTSLALPGSADDDLLKIVGKFCPALVRLDVSFSYTVSDRGLLRFLALKKPCKRHRPDLASNDCLEGPSKRLKPLVVDEPAKEEEAKITSSTHDGHGDEDDGSFFSLAMPMCSCLTYLNIWATSVTAAGLVQCLQLPGNLCTLVFHNADILEAAIAGTNSSRSSTFSNFTTHAAEKGTKMIDQAMTASSSSPVTPSVESPKGGHSVRHLILSRLPETYKMGPFAEFFPKLESVYVRGATTNYQMAHLLERRDLKCFKSNHLEGLLNQGLIERWSNLTQIHLRLPGLDIDVAAIASCCPLLEEMRFENGMFVIGSHHMTSIAARKGFPKLKRLGLNTPLPIGEFESSYIFLPPSVIAFALQHSPVLESADFGYCSAVNDDDLDRVLFPGSEDVEVETVMPLEPLNPFLEKLTLRGAYALSDDSIFKIIRSFPALKLFAMKILPRERLAEMEKIKTQLKAQNIDVTLMTYGNY